MLLISSKSQMMVLTRGLENLPIFWCAISQRNLDALRSVILLDLIIVASGGQETIRGFRDRRKQDMTPVPKVDQKP